MNDALIVYSLPVSGGSFPTQLGLLSEVYKAKLKLHNGKFESSKDYCPDLVLASSGGNVASYIGLGGDWSPEGIKRVIKNLNSHLFVKSWFPNYMSGFIPTIVVGIFKGSLYRNGYGANYLFNRIFTTETIQNTEIWTGTFNMTKNKAEFFCNRSLKRAMIQNTFFQSDTEIYNALPLRYVGDENQHLKKLSDVCIASASIPYLVQNEKIDDDHYSDGGVMYASPTIVFGNEIYRLVKGFEYEDINTIDQNGFITKENIIIKPKRMRHFYFSCYDTMSAEPGIKSSTLGIGGTILQILHANTLLDLAAAINNLQRLYGVEGSQITHKHYIDVNTNQLGDILIDLEKYDHYVIDLYPKGSKSISVDNFNYKEIIEIMNQVQKNYAVQVWYHE